MSLTIAPIFSVTQEILQMKVAAQIQAQQASAKT